MIASLIISIIAILGMILFIIFLPSIKIGKLQLQTFWICPLIGAILLLAFQLVDAQLVWNELVAPTVINPLQILAIFLSMVFLSIVLDEIGFFKYVAYVAVKRAKGNQFSLFFILSALTAFLTIFTSNDIIIITFTPFIIFFCKNAKINPIPYLVSEFVMANTWSMILIIGNPTNIYIASSYGIDFVNYIKVMALPTLFAGLTAIILMFLLFRKQLKTKIETDINEEKIMDKTILVVTIVLFSACIVLLCISNIIALPMWIIAVSATGILLLFLFIYSIWKHQTLFIIKNSFVKLPWNIIPLLISMFVIVISLNYYQITNKIYEFFGDNMPIITYGATSALSANLINNIPMSVLYSEILKCGTGTLDASKIYATIIGSNLAAIITPIGALAGIMWMSILKRYEIKYNFLTFCKYGVLIGVPTLAMSLFGLFLSMQF